MKIGILSMQKILNYGSFLQAFSLKKQFENRGHDVYFIDIEPGRTICAFETEQQNILKKLDKYFLKRIENYFLDKRMSKIHKDDYERFLHTEKHLADGARFGLVVIGSDEVFNATIPSRWGFTTQLFGNVDNADQVVTYAASCGSTTLESVRKYGIEDDIRNALKNVQKISVRDQNTFDFVMKITGRVPEINVDPVFLLDYSPYIQLPKRTKPYLLVYAYGNRINDENEIRAIKKYAKDNNLEIICVGMQQRWCSKNIAANAFELLGYVKKAECVVTDTFHGTVFSIKYNKKFISIIRQSNKQKLGGLLIQFGLSERALYDMKVFGSVMDRVIDYEKVNRLIKEEQDKSQKYLDFVCNDRKA